MVGVLRSSRMNVAVVDRGYYQLGALARLELSLLQFVFERARAHGFRLVAVPDVLPAHYLVRAILLSLPLPLPPAGRTHAKPQTRNSNQKEKRCHPRLRNTVAQPLQVCVIYMYKVLALTSHYTDTRARRRAPACRCSTRRALSSTDSPAPQATTQTQARETRCSSLPPHRHRPLLPRPTGTCFACRAPRRWRSPLSAPTVSFASTTSRLSIPFPRNRTFYLYFTAGIFTAT